MADFRHFIEGLITKEGGYVLTDDPDDRGGQTYAGISRRAKPNWPGWPYIDRGEAVPRELVHQKYKGDYWDVLCLDDITDEVVAECLFSSCVLSGHTVASRLAQIAADVKPDGHVGPVTVGAINDMPRRYFIALFSLARIARFADILEATRSQRKYFRGWCNRVLDEVKF